MTVQSAQSVTVIFTTRAFATGVGTNADSLPTGVLYKNGTSSGQTVTVTNVSTGLYKAAVTMPTLAIGDEVELVIAATVSTISDSAVVWGDTYDLNADANGKVLLQPTQTGVTIPTVTTVGTLTNLPPVTTDWLTAAGVKADAVTKIQSGLSTYAGGDTSGTTTLLARLTATRAGLLDNLDAAISTRMATFSYTSPPAASAIVTSIMTDLLSSSDFSTAGSFGKLIKDYLDVAVSSRLATSGYTVPPTAAQNRQEMDTNSTQLSAIKGKTDSMTFTIASHIDATATVDTATIAAAVIAGIGSNGVTVQSPVITTNSSTGLPVRIEIVQGMDYSNTDGTQITLTMTGMGSYPSWTSGTVYLDIDCGTTLSKAGTITTATGSTRVVRFDLTASETALFTDTTETRKEIVSDVGWFDVRVVLSDSARVNKPISKAQFVARRPA